MKRKGACILLNIVIAVIAVVLSGCSDKQAEDVARTNGMTVEEVKTAYDLAGSYFNTGQYLEAMYTYEEISGYKDSDAKREESLGAYQEEITEKARGYAGQDKNYGDALALIRQARQTVGDCSLFREAEAEIEAAYLDEYLERAQEELDEGDFTAAADLLSTISQAVSVTDPRITAMEVFITKGRVLAAWDEYRSGDDIANGLIYLRTLLMEGYDDPDVMALYNQEYSAYKKQVMDNAQSQFQTSGYEAAIAALQSGTLVLADDADFQSKMEEYQSYRPVPLASLDYFDQEGGGFNTVDTGKDNLGNEHQNVFRVDDRAPTQTYRLYGGYERLVGICYLDFQSRAGSASGILQIYGDGVLLFDSGTLCAGVDPVPFDIQIGGVDKLTLAASTNGPYVLSDPFAFGDVMLYR